MKNNNHTVMLRHFGQWINLEAAAGNKLWDTIILMSKLSYFIMALVINSIELGWSKLGIIYLYKCWLPYNKVRDIGRC